MKASDLSLDHFISISERPGMRMKELQLTLTSADAIALLRRDLINALGIQRAKRFLLRYGYHCGAHEARILKEAIQWQDALEWLIAGSKMHQLTGRAFSYPDTFRVDMKKGTFDVSGYWNDSYEAKQHLAYFSEHIEPVCYYLVGYASGYTSECMEKQIIFKEVKCKGKGDDHCSYVGKTVEEWGKEIEEDLLYYQDEDMSAELDQMYRRVEQQKERLEIGYSLSRSLTQAMLQEKGLPAFAEILGKSLHCQVLIENKDFESIAQYSVSPGLDQYMTVKNLEKKAKDELRNHSVIERELKNKTFRLLTTAIIMKNNVYGYITIALNQKNDDFYTDLLERTATTAALYIQNERVAVETEQRLKGDLLEQLLNNKEVKPQEIHARLSLLGYDITQPHYIIHMEIESENKTKKTSLNSEYFKIYNKLTDIFNHELNRNGSHALMLPKLNTVQAIVSKKYIDGEGITIKKLGERLLQKIGGTHQQIYIGISEETTHVSEFHKKIEEAKKAVELAKVRYSSSKVILASELGHLTLFLSARAPEELEAFAVEKLYSILDYDQKKNSELVVTLFYYSQNEFNLHKTARKMSISISGMRYRLQKIEELLNLSLADSSCRFEIQLALQILLMLGKIHM
ncbi:XylR N-terminal domain-containing protein [Pseudobacillus sp. 179-B 2D1 NHS]